METSHLECKKCHAEMFEGAHFCMRCGTSLDKVGEVPTRRTTDRPGAPSRRPMAPDLWPMPSEPPVPIETLEPLGPDDVAPLIPSPPSAPIAPVRGVETSSDNRRQMPMAEISKDEVLRRVRIKQSLKRAGLSGIDLAGASLENVDFSRAELDGANLENAKLAMAQLKNASLRGAKLRGADLRAANLEGADLEDADLTGAKLPGALLGRATLERCVLAGSDLGGADLRSADLRDANLDGANLAGAKVAGASFYGARLSGVGLVEIDVSAAGDGSERLAGAPALALLTGRKLSIPPGPAARYFGKGDVLRDATLVFEPGSVIQIDSRFENCSLSLGDGAELTIGEPGVLHNCQIAGAGQITVHGRFFERSSPGIAGAKSVVVSSKGAIVGGIEQAPESTVFAFEPGSRLRVKILRPRERIAAE